jgi:hypothetical protein
VTFLPRPGCISRFTSSADNSRTFFGIRFPAILPAKQAAIYHDRMRQDKTGGLLQFLQQTEFMDQFATDRAVSSRGYGGLSVRHHFPTPCLRSISKPVAGSGTLGERVPASDLPGALTRRQ